MPPKLTRKKPATPEKPTTGQLSSPPPSALRPRTKKKTENFCPFSSFSQENASGLSKHGRDTAAAAAAAAAAAGATSPPWIVNNLTRKDTRANKEGRIVRPSPILILNTGVFVGFNDSVTICLSGRNPA
jgi:hypothetical protein